MLRECDINVNDGVVGFVYDLIMSSLNLKYQKFK